jgi:hypothetical protein
MGLSRLLAMLIQSTRRPTQLSQAATATPAAQTVAAAPAVPQDTVDSAHAAQAERISNYIAQKKLDGAEGLKQVTGLIAGQVTGMTIGSMIFAPLAFKFGNLYIATGGAAVTGGLMALAASKLASKDFSKLTDNKIGDGIGIAGSIANSLPKIAYPTLGGATGAEKEMIYEALDRLPLSGVTSAPTIDVVTGMQKAGASGLATPLFSHNRIFLDHDEIGYGKAWGQEVTTHEIGHTFDFSKGVGPILSRNFRGGGFGDEPFVSEYAHTNRMEDYADSYATYHLDPNELQRVAPEKFAAIDAAQQPGLVDQALDRPSVRDAGKKIGTAFEGAPRLRNVLALGASLIGPFQLYRGAASYEKGLENDDPVQRIQGKMNMASGAALMGPGTAPLSLLFTAGKIATDVQLSNGSITMEQAEKRADAALTVATGPFGMMASSVTSELDKAGLLVDTHKGPEFKSFAPFGMRDRKSALGKLAAGFAVGATAGGVVAPFLHAGSAHAKVFSAATGSWVGGLAGAALGLGIHMLTKPAAPTYLQAGPEQGKLTGDDKKLLAKLSAPAVVGGAAGAVGGYFGGQMLGRFIGQSLAGAAGGVTGAALGSYMGVLGGSYAASKGGAMLGANWAGLSKAEPPKNSAA